jgi:hypothetical protein
MQGIERGDPRKDFLSAANSYEAASNFQKHGEAKARNPVIIPFGKFHGDGRRYEPVPQSY